MRLSILFHWELPKPPSKRVVIEMDGARLMVGHLSIHSSLGWRGAALILSQMCDPHLLDVGDGNIPLNPC